MQFEIKIFNFLFILFQLMHFEINIFLTKHFFLSWCSLRNGSRASQSCASPGETRSFIFLATIAGIQWKCYLLYFWQHFHLWHPVKRNLIYFWQHFYLWHTLKPNLLYFWQHFYLWQTVKTRPISDNIIFLISDEKVISFIFDNIFIYDISGIAENVISFISAKIFISGTRWKRDLSLFLATFGNLGSHFCTSLANFIKVPVHYSQQWQKKIIAIT